VESGRAGRNLLGARLLQRNRGAHPPSAAGPRPGIDRATVDCYPLPQADEPAAATAPQAGPGASRRLVGDVDQEGMHAVFDAHAVCAWSACLITLVSASWATR